MMITVDSLLTTVKYRRVFQLQTFHPKQIVDIFANYIIDLITKHENGIDGEYIFELKYNPNIYIVLNELEN